MGLFDGLEEVEETEVVEESAIEKTGMFVKDSGAYKGTVTKFYFDQSDKGTTFYNVEIKTDEGQIISKREWFITKDGRRQFDEKDFKTKKPTGKKRDFSGFAALKAISRALTGDANAYAKTEEKIIPIYNREKQADVDTKKDVFVEALGKKVEILVRKIMEDKNALNPATGEYEPTREIRSYVDIRGWLDPDTHKTYNETMSGSEPKQYNKFMEVIAKQPIDDKRELSKGAGGPGEPAAEEEGSAEDGQNAFA